MLALDLVAVQSDLYETYMKPVCQSYSLTSMELSVLLFLSNNPEYDTAKDIVKIRHLTKSHVSIAVSSLEERGFLKKEYRDGDHKTVHLILEPACAEILRKGREAQYEFLSVIRRGFSEEELETISGYLRRIHENMSEALENSRRMK